MIDQIFNDPRANRQSWVLIEQDSRMLIRHKCRLGEISWNDQSNIGLLLIDCGSGTSFILHHRNFQHFHQTVILQKTDKHFSGFERTCGRTPRSKLTMTTRVRARLKRTASMN